MDRPSDDKIVVHQALHGYSSGHRLLQASVTLPLAAQRSGNNLILRWTDPSFGLQAGPVVTGPYTNVPGATSPCTNPIAGRAKFFRLKAN